ncbi:hypothetical protein Hanom_Chr07g00667351 [Helianthus anomalus]
MNKKMRSVICSYSRLVIWLKLNERTQTCLCSCSFGSFTGLTVPYLCIMLMNLFTRMNECHHRPLTWILHVEGGS